MQTDTDVQNEISIDNPQHKFRACDTHNIRTGQDHDETAISNAQNDAKANHQQMNVGHTGFKDGGQETSQARGENQAQSDKEHSRHLPIKSARDLEPLYEAFSEEDDDDGNPIFLYSSFGFITDDHVAYFGQSKLRKRALTAKEIKDSLKLLPDDDVFPVVPESGITTFSAAIHHSLFLKGPKLATAFIGTGLLPQLLLQEARIMELLLRNPHANIIRYHGCLIRRGRIAGIVLDRYDMTLKQRLDRLTTRRFDVETYMTQIESAISHLHSHGLAHNDLTPMNIMVDENDGTLVLIDFGSCQPFKNQLITAGTPGWIDEDYSTSAKEHDEKALKRLRSWLYEMREEV